MKHVRENKLIDALEALPATPFEGTVWRVVREGRDPCQCNAAGGRWDDRTFDVLYTSAMGDGAVAELYFHLSRGQPVVPSKVRYRLHELRVNLEKCLCFSDLTELETLGLQSASFGQLSYDDRQQEYPQSQEIAETAHFLGNHGLIVPSARWDCSNIVVFCELVGPTAVEEIKDHGFVDWSRWKEKPYGF